MSTAFPQRAIAGRTGVSRADTIDQTIDLQLSGDPLVADLYTPPGGGTIPVLLIHGWGGSGRYWRGTIRRLRGQFRLVVPDLPGVGRSLPVARGRTIPDQVAALEALLARLGITRVQVVGHSMGGAIGMLLAARRPALVERLALVGLSLFRNDAERVLFGGVTELSAVLMRFRTTAMAELPYLARQFAARFFYRVPDDAELLREGFLDYLRMDYATALASMRSVTNPAIPEAAAKLRCPTLLVVSRQDQIMPVANVPATARAIVGCRVRWIENCGHLPMVEQPDVFAETLREFLAEDH